MGLLRTLLFIILVYYLVKFLARVFGPMLFGYAAKKAEQRFQDKFNQYQNHSSRTTQKEGEVTIDKKPKGASKAKNNVGEYIDFEEID